ncbi:endonuclease-reverse transcriptase [Elysia marginata]|uniref:Endonuclease-reverse transcriptase n=1 Tax=Elysia marginata TaxID=1093978 RepID=A0AAV4IEW1_9GAST|nr:endonuclease-reverse transcriptase [Elysia marginata]
MLYGCETWTMRKADESKIKAAEMWFFRRLLRVSWKDRRTNGNVLAEMGTGRTLLSLVKERRLKYIRHAERNKKTDLMKTIFEGKTEAKRGRGRPSLSYVDQVSKATGLKLQSIWRKSQDRVIWRGIVKSSCAAANINPDAAASWAVCNNDSEASVLAGYRSGPSTKDIMDLRKSKGKLTSSLIFTSYHIRYDFAKQERYTDIVCLTYLYRNRTSSCKAFCVIRCNQKNCGYTQEYTCKKQGLDCSPAYRKCNAIVPIQHNYYCKNKMYKTGYVNSFLYILAVLATKAVLT